MMNTAVSEWTKLRTTAALRWTTALFVLFSVGYAILTALSTKALRNNPDVGMALPLGATEVTASILTLGAVVLIIQATMVVTSEYRHNTISATFQATPNRVLVALAKLAVYGTYSVLLTLLCTLASLVTVRALYSDADFTLFDDAATRVLWTLPLYIFLIVVLTMGVAWLLRQTAGAIALMLIWLLALENILGFLPKIGVYIQRFGPFSNLNAFMAKTSIPDAPWEYTGSLVYFTVIAVAFFGLGVLLLTRRDA